MPILNEMFPAYKLNSDLVFIKNKAVYKRYKYDGLLYAGKKNFYTLYDSIENVINERGEMSRLDFYFLTAPLVRLLQDDKSYYSLNGKMTFDSKNNNSLPFVDKAVIPFGVHVFHDTAYISTYDSEFYKSRLISINNIPANKIVSEIYKYSSFKKYRYYKKHKYASLGLYYYPILTKVLFDFQDEVEIEYSPFESDTILRKHLTLLPIGDTSYYNYIDQKIASETWYKLLFQNNIAILRIKSLPEREINLHIINDIFKRINKMNPKALIIDISRCYWSHDSFWITILNYLYEGELWLFEHHKEAKDLSKYTKKRLKNKDYIVGKYSDLNMDYKYNGDLYLITGTSTASSSVRFADILIYNNIVGKIYGSESLTKTTQYDFGTTHYLPITGLKLVLSVSLYYALDKNKNTHGLIPDIEVEPKNEKEYHENIRNKLVIQKVIELIEAEELDKNKTTD